MRIIRLSDLSAVVLVKGRGVCTVAIPERLSSDEVLELASLVLSTSEYEEFVHAALSPDRTGVNGSRRRNRAGNGVIYGADRSGGRTQDV